MRYNRSKHQAVFDAPYLSAVIHRAEEAGGAPIDLDDQEARGALRELRRIRRAITNPRFICPDGVLEWVDGNIAALRDAMAQSPAVMEAPRCTRCEKRPRWFGDLCRRCAEELGERPTGKV